MTAFCRAVLGAVLLLAHANVAAAVLLYAWGNASLQLGTHEAGGPGPAALRGRSRRRPDDGAPSAAPALLQLQLRRQLPSPGGPLNETEGAQRMVQKLSEELLRLEVEMDSQRRDCALREQMAGEEVMELQSAASRAAERAASLEATVADYSGQLTKAGDDISEARENIKDKHKDCGQRRAALQLREQDAREELGRVRRLVKQMVGACYNTSFIVVCERRTNGRVLAELGHAALRQQAWRARRRLLGRQGSARAAMNGTASRRATSRTCRAVRASARAALRTDSRYPTGVVMPAKDLDPSAFKPEPSPESLSSGAGPGRTSTSNCVGIEDNTDEMETAATAQLTQATAEVASQDAKCESELDAFRASLAARVAQLTQAQGIVSQAESSRSELNLQHREIAREVQDVTQRKEALRASCKESLETLKTEIAGVIETRQLIFGQYFATEGTIQDCVVSDWAIGPCSKTCLGPSGEPGQQVLTRTLVVTPDATTLRGRLGAKCPPLTEVRKCGARPCPIDCIMGSWSDWAGCSRECGSGMQSRSRATRRVGVFGGMICGAATETRACNVGTCSQDCRLDAWSDWGPCSRRCLWTPASTPGHAHRARIVTAPAVGGGSCPPWEDRREFRECNPFACPADLQSLQCTADQDIIVLIDGSGSVMNANATEGGADRYFQRQKDFAAALIQNSELRKPGTPRGVRIGLVVFGGQSRPQILSELSGDKQALLATLADAKWPNGITAVAQALGAARQMLRGSSARRHSTVVILSDGRLRRVSIATEAATQLRGDGARVVALLVQGGRDPAAPGSDRNFCAIASSPCVDNVLRLEEWGHLTSQLGRFLAAICPAGFTGPGSR